MQHEPEDIESFLGVGLVAYLHPLSAHGGCSRYKTVIRGWQKGSYILLETPSGEEKLPIFAEDRLCTMRFLHEGRACGFGSRVLDCGTTGAFGYARIAWPRQVEMVRVRKQERIQISIPCRIAIDAAPDAEGVVVDLSSGGCCVRCKGAITLKDNEVVGLYFTLPDGSLIKGIRAIVRNVRAGNPGSILGCEFHEDEDFHRQDINFYVTSTLERMRGTPSRGRRIVVIDSHEDTVRTLGRALQQLDFEVLAAGGIIDAFYRLRVSNPLVVFVGSEQDELTVPQICRIVKSTRGLEKVALFVYGGNSEDLRREALEAGADEYFAAASKIAAIRAALERHVPAEAEVD